MGTEFVRSAGELMRAVPAVERGDAAVMALELLRDAGVVVLVDDRKRPVDLLTTESLPQITARVGNLKEASSVDVLFAPVAERHVVSVRVADDLDTVIRKISTNRLWPGVVVVDDQDRYVGYIFNDDLRKKTKENLTVVQQLYPEAWAKVGAPLVGRGRD